jgi:hypothetical protein
VYSVAERFSPFFFRYTIFFKEVLCLSAKHGRAVEPTRHPLPIKFRLILS